MDERRYRVEVEGRVPGYWYDVSPFHFIAREAGLVAGRALELQAAQGFKATRVRLRPVVLGSPLAGKPAEFLDVQEADFLAALQDASEARARI